jgi:hypothetical protein
LALLFFFFLSRLPKSCQCHPCSCSCVRALPCDSLISEIFLNIADSAPDRCHR